MRQKVSVIIPVYNMERYLEKCIQSVCGQTYKNIEIILVNDGSTDKSAEICEVYAQKDDRIRVINKENEGVLFARKTGTAYATGSYIMYIDGDDWVERQMVEKMLSTGIEYKADIISCAVIREYEYGVVEFYDGVDEGVYSGEKLKEVYEKMCWDRRKGTQGISSSLCNKMFRSNVIKPVMESVIQKVTCYEDAMIVYACYIEANTVVSLKDLYYHYIIREGSATHTGKHIFFFSEINYIHSFLKRYIQKSTYQKVLEDQLEKFTLRLLWMGEYKLFGFSEENKFPMYVLPRFNIPIGTRIVLYGAGNVGRDLYKQINAKETYNIIGWVDKKMHSENILPVEKLIELDYDYIIIAVYHYDIAREIVEGLEKKYQINSDKIIWEKPETVFEHYWN